MTANILIHVKIKTTQNTSSFYHNTMTAEISIQDLTDNSKLEFGVNVVHFNTLPQYFPL